MSEEHSQVTNIQAVIEEVAEEGRLKGLLSADEKALVRIFESRISHSGPLPSPETLAAYVKVLPSAAERIMSMAEGQSSHRRAMEEAVILGNVRAQARGVWCAFFLALTGMLAGFYLALRGQGLTGFSIFLTSLATLVGTFIFARVDQRKERQEKHSADADEEG